MKSLSFGARRSDCIIGVNSFRIEFLLTSEIYHEASFADKEKNELTAMWSPTE